MIPKQLKKPPVQYKTFFNGYKVPLIPHFLVNNEFATDALVNANLFNDFFREQCRHISNQSSKVNLGLQTFILTLILLLNLFLHWIQTKIMAVMESQYAC